MCSSHSLCILKFVAAPSCENDTADAEPGAIVGCDSRQSNVADAGAGAVAGGQPQQQPLPPPRQPGGTGQRWFARCSDPS